jgi:pimeloyl-ACP methyl ester carboxylesterase
MVRKETFIHFSGVRLYTRLLIPEGQRMDDPIPVTVFLHEGLGSADQWKDFPERFLKKCQTPVLLYDRLGYGRSSRQKEKRGLDYLHKEEKLLHLLLQKLHIGKYILLGHSEGGSLALIHAAQHPSGLLKVITLSANTQEEPCIAPAIEKVKKEYEKPGSKLKAALQQYHGEQCDAVFYAWSDTWTAQFFQSWNILPELKNIRVPLLAFHGGHDQYTSLVQIENIRKWVPGIKETILFEKGSHHLHFDEPEKVLSAICAFINTDGGRL